MTTHRDFFTALLKRLGIPTGTAALNTLAAVSLYESSQGDEKWWNPLACEQDWPGATDYNRAGVKVYPSFDAGVRASAEMYAGPHWASVRHQLSTASWRGPMLDAFSDAYTWAHIDFRHTFTVPQMTARLSHPLRGPN